MLDQPVDPEGRLTWFTQARFGMFVHWGLYSLAARHEWVQSREAQTEDEYRRYFEHFDPVDADIGAWVRDARDAGMKYVVLTAKHHDGFCLWNTRTTDFSAPHTPWGRDAVAEFVAACRAEGMRIGLYYSLIDWHHADFVIDELHPERDRDALARNAERDMSRYRDYMVAQLTELLTEYGAIDYLFFDYSYPDLRTDERFVGKGARDWNSERLLALCRRLQPRMLVNDRLGIHADFVTPEQYQPASRLEREGVAVAWEACQTLNGSWGYDAANTAFKSEDLLIRMLVDTVSKGGNMLLNVAPDGQGRLDEISRDTLSAIGGWHRLHSRAIVGAGTAELPLPLDARYTRRENRLYLHLFAWPFERIDLPGLGGRVGYAQFLHNAAEVPISRGDPSVNADLLTPQGADEDVLHLHLPAQKPKVAVPVIELFLEE
ncbi:alpha-L-fucosidase [Microbacterium jejuense]|uniref:alpha-L-fucosidase n=1 Tax=Microbacterium jejuense TaxID=1263637 RepID=UPI0027E27CE8|nr:alpha-L-fucosidase [Microbacterium jejuense]